MGNMELFCGVSRHSREATYNVSVLLHFFPTNHYFQLSVPGLESQRFRADVESWDWVTSFLRIIYIAYHKQLCNDYKIFCWKNHISHFYFFFSFLALYYLMLILAYFISKNGFRWKVYDEIEDIRAVNHETSKKMFWEDVVLNIIF